MNWENSKVLTRLKADFLKAFFKRDTNFFLSGGSALGVFYLDHRRSYDLDFFSMEEVHWQSLKAHIWDIANEIKASVESLSASPHFCRYQLTRGEEREILDYVIEFVPQVYKEKKHFGQIRVDQLEEIGINKICTLVHRSEIKDVIDLFFLQRDAGFDIFANLENAKKKEGGLEPAMVSYLLSQAKVERLPDYLEKELSIQELELFIEQLRQKFADLATP